MPKCIDCKFYVDGECEKLPGWGMSDIENHDSPCGCGFEPKPKLKKTTPEIRQFETGATRDTDANKPSYVKALSPIALQYYVNYLGHHRVQSDGSLRDWDNWKKGIPQDVYLDGLGRHKMAVWLLCHGFPSSDNHGPVTLKDSLCGVIFNAMGMLHEILQKEQ